VSGDEDVVVVVESVVEEARSEVRVENMVLRAGEEVSVICFQGYVCGLWLCGTHPPLGGKCEDTGICGRFLLLSA
jgi:hypothetical protein